MKYEKLRKYLPLAIIPLVLGVVLMLWLNLVGGNLVYVFMTRVDNEWVFDLRNADFDNNFYKLQGSVPMLVRGPEAIPFISPENLDDYYFINAYRHLITRDFQDSDRGAWNTSRLRILLPEDEWVSFSRVSVGHAMRLYVNSHWMLDVGSPGMSRHEETARQSRISFTVLPDDGAVELVQQASTFVHWISSMHSGWYIGNYRLHGAIRNVDYIQNIILGTFLALFLMYALMFFLQGTNIYFAIFCLIWFFRLGTIGSYVLSDIFPNISWVMQYRLELLAIPISAWTITAILNTLFPSMLQKYFRIAIYIGSFGFMLFIAFFDTITVALNLHYMYYFYGAAILYVLVRAVLKIRRVNLAQGIFLMGCGFFLYTSMREFLYRQFFFTLPPFDVTGMMYNEMAVAVTTMITVLVFAFCMAAAIFISTKEEVETAIKTRARLAADNASLLRLDKMKADLIANVTHETLTPLSVLSVYSELVARELRGKNIDEQTAKDLESISDEAIHIASLLDELNSNTGASENRFIKTALNLPDLVRSTVRLYNLIVKRTGTALEIDIDSDLPKVYANTGEITQVLFNIVQNAHKHTVKGIITVKVFSDGDFVKTIVSDTGSGIPKELLPFVFERGVSGNKKNEKTGTNLGLGLALSKEIIESHGGTIGAESKHGKGTKVWFTLPVFKDEG